MSLRRPLPLLPTSSDNTLGISLKPLTPLDSAAPDALLSDLVRRNGLQGLSYAGCAAPCTLLASGEEAALDALRNVWARGALRAPQGYAVLKLGDVSGSLWLHPVAPAAFAPLSDALLQCIGGRPASADALRRALRRAFPRMRPPDPDALHAALGQLVRERKICHNGQGYLLVQSCSFGDTDTQLASGGRRSLSVQVDDTDIPVPAPTREVACQITQVVPSPDLQRVHSLKAPRARAPPDGGSFDRSFSEKRRNEFSRLKKGEKQGESVLSKLLRRMQQSLSEGGGGKSRVTFSAQFPPPEWADQVTVGHSVATQTLLLQKGVTKSPIKKHDIPWMDTELDVQNFGPCFHKIKPRTTGPIPHRSSSRRRHHRRRSSSESPKSRKLKNRSNDPNDAKVTLSSSSGEPTYQKDSNKSDEYKANEASIANKESKSFRTKPLLKSVAFQTPRKVTNDYVLDTTPPLSIDEDTGENATPSLASEFDSSLSAILSDPKLAISEDSSSLISTPPVPAKRFFQPSTLLQNRKNTGSKDSNNVIPRMPYCIKDHKNGTMKAISNVLKDNPHYGTLNKNGLKEKNHYGTLNPNILRTICPQNVHRPNWKKSGISLTPTVLKNNQVNPEKKPPNSPPEKDTSSPLAKGNALTWRYPLDGYTPIWKERLSVVPGSKDGSENNMKVASRETPEGNTSSRGKSPAPAKPLPSYHSRPPVLKNLIDIPVPRKSNLSNDAGGNQSLLVKNSPKPPILKKLIEIPSVKTTSFSKDVPPLSPLKTTPNATTNSVLEAKRNDKTPIFESPITKTDILISHHPQDLTKTLTNKDSTSKTSENTMDNKSVVVDNSVSIEVEVQKKGSSGGQLPVATVVTEETTTVSKGKVVTVTSVTTSLSHGAIKDLSVDTAKVNDLNVESKNLVDCSSSCNIVTEVK